MRFAAIRMRLSGLSHLIVMLCCLVASAYYAHHQQAIPGRSAPLRRYHQQQRSSSSSTRSNALFDDSLDISPERDGSIFKKLVRRGNGAKGYPLAKDVVQIAWKIFAKDGSLVHDSSSKLDEPFEFVLGADPRQVIMGWEVAVGSMFEGEVASFTIAPHKAFGEKGAPPLVEPNSILECELEVLEIKPAITRSYKSVGLNESIREELVDNIRSGQSVITDEVMQNKQINETKSNEERKFFDPSRHKEDPNQRVLGEGDGHIWEETGRTIDVEIPLPKTGGVWRKNELEVVIKSTEISVKVIESGQVLLRGPLSGKIVVSESMWAILEPDPAARGKYKGQRVLLSMEKSYGHKEIWASVIDRSMLEQTKIRDNDDDNV